MKIDDSGLASRDRQSFEAGFEAGRDWMELSRDYGRMLVESAVRDRIDENWLSAAADFLKKTAPEVPLKLPLGIPRKR